MVSLAEGVACVGLALKEKKEKNIQNALEFQKLCDTFEIKLGESEFTGFIPPLPVEIQMIEDWTKLELDEFAVKYFEIIFGFDPETINRMNRRAISILMGAYSRGYRKVMRDKSFLDEMGTE